MQFILNEPCSEGWTEETTSEIGSELKKEVLREVNTPIGNRKLILETIADDARKGIHRSWSVPEDKFEINLSELYKKNSTERYSRSEFN